MRTMVIKSELTSVKRSCTVYPALTQKCGGRGRGHDQRGFKLRGLSWATAACLAGAAALGLGAFAALEPGDSVVAGISLADIKLRGVFGSAKNNYLLSLSRETERQDIQGQVHFVAQIIGQFSRAPHEARRLALSIVEESLRAKYDPLFVAAVIKSESLFRKNARSQVGARGLMQLMPDTARFIANSIVEHLGVDGNLNDPEYNIKIGIAYLKRLEEQFDGNKMHTLIAYNWGPGNLSQALDQNSRIPSSTVQYASKIIATHRRWRRDFDGRRADGSLFSETLTVRG